MTPSLKNKDFLEFLENIILYRNTNDRFLIVGVSLVDNDGNAKNEDDNLYEDENSHDLIDELNSFDHEQDEFD
ncbi:unnamed protein product [Brachionus calyciflorus]|uniref:Uncharacterized protein n=1 Tax=Brachionus calyciflorus TaxID=104777 RepID=A0A814CUP4_9BILA|nr:unnamed protein product [Brachionus calyciflorus]